MHLIDPSIAAQFDRLPPSSIEAEQCALASLLLAGDDATLFAETMALLTRESFFSEDNRIIFNVICERADSGKPIDGVLIRQDLIDRQLLDEVGGTSYLAQIFNAVPSAAHGRHYAGIVREKYALRRLIATSNDVLRGCYAPSADPDEIYQKLIDRAASEHTTGQTMEAVLLEDVLHDVYDEATGEGVPMMPMPFEFMNDWMGGGVAGGEFVIIAGWPSHGKSALCKQIASHLVKRRYAGGIVSLEESRKKIARNMLSSATGVNNKDIRRGKVTSQQAAMLAKGISEMADRKLFIHDTAQTLPQIVTAIDLGVAKQGWKWAMVDHIDLIDTGKMDNEENETTRHNHLSRTLKHTAKRLNIPLFAVKQLKKRGTAIRKPSPDDLRASGAYHADADIVLFVDSDDVHHREDPNWNATFKTSIIGSKVREGTGGMRYVEWRGQTQSYTEIETRESYAQPPSDYDPFQGDP